MSRGIYLAGPSAEMPRVRTYAAILDAVGAQFTHRWWDDPHVGHDAELSYAVQRATALTDLRGVDSADVVWLLWPEHTSHGTAVEFGYAVGRGDAWKCIISGPGARRCLFTSLARRFDSDDEALQAVLLTMGLRAEAAELLPAAWVP